MMEMMNKVLPNGLQEKQRRFGGSGHLQVLTREIFSHRELEDIVTLPDETRS